MGKKFFNWNYLKSFVFNFVGILGFVFLFLQPMAANAVCPGGTVGVPVDENAFPDVLPGAFSSSVFTQNLTSTPTVNCSNFDNATAVSGKFTGQQFTGTLNYTCVGATWTRTSGTCASKCIGNNPSINLSNLNVPGGVVGYGASFSGSPFTTGSTQTINCSNFDNGGGGASTNGDYFTPNPSTQTLTATCGVVAGVATWAVTGSCVATPVCSTSNPSIAFTNSDINIPLSGAWSFSYTGIGAINPTVTSDRPTGHNNPFGTGESTAGGVPGGIWAQGSNFTVSCSSSFDDNTSGNITSKVPGSFSLNNDYFTGNYTVTCNSSGNWVVSASTCSKITSNAPCNHQSRIVPHSKCTGATDSTQVDPNNFDNTFSLDLPASPHNGTTYTKNCSSFGSGQYCDFSGAGQVQYQCQNGSWMAVNAGQTTCVKAQAQCGAAASILVPYEDCGATPVPVTSVTKTDSIPFTGAAAVNDVGAVFSHECALQTPAANCYYDDYASTPANHVDYKCSATGVWVPNFPATGLQKCPVLHCDGVSPATATPTTPPSNLPSIASPAKPWVPNLTNPYGVSPSALITLPYGRKNDVVFPPSSSTPIWDILTPAPAPYDCTIMDDENAGLLFEDTSVVMPIKAFQYTCTELVPGGGRWEWRQQKSCVLKAPVIACSLDPVPSFNVVTELGLIVTDLSMSTVYESTSFPDYVQFVGTCTADRNGVKYSSARITFPGIPPIPACGVVNNNVTLNAASGLCYEQLVESSVVPFIATPLATEIGIDPKVVAKVTIKNYDKTPSNIPAGKIKLTLNGLAGPGSADFPFMDNSTGSPLQIVTTDFNNITPIGSMFTAVPALASSTVTGSLFSSYCQILPGGVIGNVSAGGAIYTVPPGEVLLNLQINGAYGEAMYPVSVSWSGTGVSAGTILGQGKLSGATTAGIDVSASVTTYAGSVLSCQVKLKTDSAAFSVRLNKFADCDYFEALRTYYLTDPSDPSKARTSAYNAGAGIQFPGIAAIYGSSGTGPDIPFKGVINGAAYPDGAVVILPGGKVSPPADVSNRRYSKAVLTAHKYTNTPACLNCIDPDPDFYAIMDYSGYTNTQLIERAATTPADSTTYVFRAFLATQFLSGNDLLTAVDLRGSASIPDFRFLQAGSDKTHPWDRIIPFVNESCLPMFMITPPALPGEGPLPAKLAATPTCSFSRPFTYADIKTSVVSLNIMHIVPEMPDQEFPLDLVRATYKPPVVVTGADLTDLGDCWSYAPPALGQNVGNLFAAHDTCRAPVLGAPASETIVSISNCGTGDSAVPDLCGAAGAPGYTRTLTQNIAASCPVHLTSNSCKNNLDVRLRGFTQMKTAALGCIVNYDSSALAIPTNDFLTSGMSVTPTLTDQGYLPSGALFGGADPAPFASYTAAQNPEGKGYGCIPCRFEQDAAIKGQSLVTSTKPLITDFTAGTRTSVIFNGFVKLKAPKKSISKNVVMTVDYFGSAPCAGTDTAAAGFMCDSSSANPGASCAGNTFTVDLCPGYGFEYESVSPPQ